MDVSWIAGGGKLFTFIRMVTLKGDMNQTKSVVNEVNW